MSVKSYFLTFLLFNLQNIFAINVGVGIADVTGPIAEIAMVIIIGLSN